MEEGPTFQSCLERLACIGTKATAQSLLCRLTSTLWVSSHHDCEPAAGPWWPGLIFRSRSDPGGLDGPRLGRVRSLLQARRAGNPFPWHSQCWHNAAQHILCLVGKACAFLLRVSWVPSSAPCRLTSLTADRQVAPGQQTASPATLLTGFTQTSSSGSPLLYARGSSKGQLLCPPGQTHCVSACVVVG